MTATDVAVDIAATYRIVRFLQSDTFPTLEEWREEVRTEGSDLAAELLDCPWCLSMWVGAGVMIARTVAPKPWGFAARVLAASAATGLIRDWKDR